MINFLHTYLPQPILFQFGFLKIHWYGVLVVAGVIAGLIVVLKLAKRLGIVNDEVYNLAFYLVIFGLLGGRLYAILLDLPFYLKNPLEIIIVWHGGLAIHGTIIAGLITLLIYCWRKKQNFWQWADLIAPALALGQALGRWGNYFNQELFGKPTELPWGIPIALQNRPMEFINSPYFQPTFLYESLLNLLNFLVLVFLIRFRTMNYKLGTNSSKFIVPGSRLTEGIVALVYLINYSIIRILMEFLRVDSTPVLFGLRLPILVSGVIIILSLGVIVWRIAKSATSPNLSG